MRFGNIFTTRKFFLLPLALGAGVFISPGLANAQAGPPKTETLLNGLKVLMWPDAKADKVSVRVRIHSGSAFDPQGKEGVMQMLADSFFPNEAAREFFSEDLGGSLEIRATYDLIEVTASSRPDKFLTMIETVATAVSNPQIDKETTAKLRTALLKKLEQQQNDPIDAADLAVSQRLFGTFPYGRPRLGSAASLQKIDFADLVDARQRFITADNATIAVVGNFDRALGFRAIRRYFGSWLKADKKVPSTFKQPDEPASGALRLPSPTSETGAIRFAMRGSARGGKDYAASTVFAAALDARLKSRAPSTYASGISVSNNTHVLPGMIVIRLDASRDVMSGTDREKEFSDMVTKALAEPFTQSELESARRSVGIDKTDIATVWLDADTFKFDKPESSVSAIDNVTVGDLNGYAERIRRLPMAVVIAVGPRPSN